MSQPDIVRALGPGTHLSSLGQATITYNTATSKFNTLLQYPFLQSIVLNEDGKDDRDLRTIVSDGSGRFRQLCTTNISVAQQVNSYGRTVPTLLKALQVNKYASSTAPLIAKYIAESQANSNGNEEFFTDFKAFLGLLNHKVAELESKIGGLTTKIQQANTELANANVGRVIGDLIRSLFKITTGANADIQIATLLKVGIDTLQTSFTQLWQDQQRLKDLIKGLNDLKSNLSAIKALFVALSNALTNVISDTQSLLTLWEDVKARMDNVKNVDRKVTDGELQQVTTNWQRAQAAATAYVNAVSGSTASTSFSALVSAAPLSGILALPHTEAELKVAELLTSTNSYSDSEIPFPSSFGAAVAGANVTAADKDKIKRVAGPPADTKAVLDEMSLRTSGIMKQFNELLQVPFLNQLQCTNPDKPAEKINIQTMVTNYQKMYWDLQQDTVPLAQDLQTYSTTVLALLPKVTSSSTAAAGQVTVDTYLTAHKGLANQYKGRADIIFQRSLTYKSKWDNAINAVVQAAKECETNITTWEKSIDDLNAEIKKLTLKAALMGVGALLCFAAAAFMPGGLLMTGALVAGGIALLTMTVQAVQQIGKLRETINELRAKIEVARTTKARLESLLPLMRNIATSLTNVSNVWSTITQSLNTVDAWHELLIVPSLIDTVRPDLIKDWTEIKTATQRYMDIVTGKAK